MTLFLDLQPATQRLSPLPIFSPSCIRSDVLRTQFIPRHLDGVRERRLGRLGHEGNQEGGEESDHPEHYQGDLGSVHLELHNKRCDLQLNCIVFFVLDIYLS